MAKSDGGSVVWFVAGAAVGASIALLYAPQSGEKTRRFLWEKTREGRESLAENAGDLMEKGRDLYEKGLRIADEAAELFERGRRLAEGD